MSLDEPKSFGFVVLPKFAMLAFTSAIEPLRAANMFSRRQLYEWHVLSQEGGAVRASNGSELLTQSISDEVSSLSSVVICGGQDSHLMKTKPYSVGCDVRAGRGRVSGRFRMAPMFWRGPGCWTGTAAPSTGAAWLGFRKPSLRSMCHPNSIASTATALPAPVASPVST